jgi:hypothetical protein
MIVKVIKGMFMKLHKYIIVLMFMLTSCTGCVSRTIHHASGSDENGKTSKTKLIWFWQKEYKQQ